jgi:hypothetical protein
MAPEPYLSACLAVLRESIVFCRARGWNNDLSSEHLADLMDAIHNIPELIRNWERCDIELLRNSYLLAYEAKWLGRGGLALCTIFDDTVSGNVR